MKVKTKYFKDGKNCKGCNWERNLFFKLDGWDKDDYLCGDCFAQEMKHYRVEVN